MKYSQIICYFQKKKRNQRGLFFSSTSSALTFPLLGLVGVRLIFARWKLYFFGMIVNNQIIYMVNVQLFYWVDMERFKQYT